MELLALGKGRAYEVEGIRRWRSLRGAKSGSVFVVL